MIYGNKLCDGMFLYFRGSHVSPHQYFIFSFAGQLGGCTTISQGYTQVVENGRLLGNSVPFRQGASGRGAPSSMGQRNRKENKKKDRVGVGGFPKQWLVEWHQMVGNNVVSTALEHVPTEVLHEGLGLEVQVS
jgi:hypothetical protein